MKIRGLLKKTLYIAIVISLVFAVSCAEKPKDEANPQSEDPTDVKQDTVEPDDGTDSAELSHTDEPTQAPTEPDAETEPSDTPPPETDEVIEKIVGSSDENGIYAIVITLSDKAADKGTVEMVYYGAKGSAQENSVVNTYRIEYYKESNGLFEIHTFYDGKVYQNQHGKDKVKVNNTFGAAVRAGSVAISYTPDGGETREIYRADAEQFR